MIEQQTAPWRRMYKDLRIVAPYCVAILAVGLLIAWLYPKWALADMRRRAEQWQRYIDEGEALAEADSLAAAAVAFQRAFDAMNHRHGPFDGSQTEFYFTCGRLAYSQISSGMFDQASRTIDTWQEQGTKHFGFHAPKTQGAVLARATLYHRMDKHQDTIVEATEFLAIQRKYKRPEGWSTVSLRDTVAFAYCATSQFDRALEMYKQILELDPAALNEFYLHPDVPKVGVLVAEARLNDWRLDTAAADELLQVIPVRPAVAIELVPELLYVQAVNLARTGQEAAAWLAFKLGRDMEDVREEHLPDFRRAAAREVLQALTTGPAKVDTEKWRLFLTE